MSGMRLGGFAVLVAMLGIAVVLGGAQNGGASTTLEKCGTKPICLTVTAQDQGSLSNPSDRYLSDSLTIRNGGTSSNLVNITVGATWTDVGGTDAAKKSVFQESLSDARCDATGNKITCTAPKALGPTDPPVTYGPLVFRTSKDAAATGLRLDATISVKERSSDTGNNPNDPTSETVNDSNSTSYESDAESDISLAGGGVANVTLATSGQQVSKLRIATGKPFDLYKLSETSTYTCPTGYTCLGQQVTTVATGLSPVNLQITYTGPLPSGFKADDVVVLHKRSDNTLNPISADCSTAFGVEPPVAEWTAGCRNVSLKHLPGGGTRLEIDAWDGSNGDWTWR